MGEYTRDFNSKYDFNKRSFDSEEDTTRPIFYYEKQLDGVTGELVDVEMVKVQSPGEHLNVFGGRVTKEHKLRWPRSYDAFKRGEDQTNGMPLSKWPEVSANVDFANQLRGFGFHTVEDVARMQDGAQRLFHGSLTWKRKAEKFLEEQAKLRGAEAAKADNAAHEAEMADLRAQLADLKAAMAGATPIERKKPGRKPKVKPEEAAA